MKYISQISVVIVFVLPFTLEASLQKSEQIKKAYGNPKSKKTNELKS